MKIKHFFIETNLWISICSALLCLSSAIVLNTEALELPLFIFLATFFTYGSQRIIKNIKSNFYKTKQSKINLSIFYMFLVISFCSALYISLGFQQKTVITIIIIGIICGVYPFWLRKIPTIKIFLISLIWTITTALLLIIENNIKLETHVILEIFGRFFFVFAITIPFDIRDIKYDAKTLRTVPQLVGIRKSKIISVVSLCIFLLLNILQVCIKQVDLLHLQAIIITTIISATFIVISNTRKSDFFFGFWIDGLSALLFATLLLANQFRY